MREGFRIPLEADVYKQILTAAYMAECELRCTPYDGSADEYIEQVARMLTADSHKFGLIMFGGCGNGKTTMMRAIQNTLTMLRNKGYISKEWQLKIITAREYVRMSQANANYNDKNENMLGIDDLGIEPTETLSYGNVSNPIIECIEHRYNKRLYTVVTTNLQPSQIRSKYGDRIADRCNEMFDRIVFKHESYR